MCQFADSPPFDDYGCDVPLVESPDLASVQTTARGIAAYDVSGMEVPPLIGHEQAAAYLSPRNFSRANLTGYKDVTSLSPYSQVFPPQCIHVRAVRAFLCEFSNLKTATLPLFPNICSGVDGATRSRTVTGTNNREI